MKGQRRLWAGLGRLVGGGPRVSALPDVCAVESEDDVLSPCTGVCVLLAAGWCSGCGRTLEQISRWSSLPPDERRAVCTEAAQRLGPPR